MRIATWNVNSIRARLDRVTGYLERGDIDVLAIQETKATDAKFPITPFTKAGYQVARHGLSQWNGVAIASRVGLENVRVGLPDCPTFGDPATVEARAISARCGGMTIYSLYVPNGREIDHPHYAYKLAWLGALRDMGTRALAENPSAPLVLCGDFNVAPQDDDVWDMAAFEGATHVTQPERDAFRAIIDAGFADLARPYTPGPGVYTFWDYQQLRFPKKQGMRIDFLLGSPAAQATVTGAQIDREERKGKGASDHAPVSVEIDRVAPIVGVTADNALVEPTEPDGADIDAPRSRDETAR